MRVVALSPLAMHKRPSGESAINVGASDKRASRGSRSPSAPQTQMVLSSDAEITDVWSAESLMRETLSVWAANWNSSLPSRHVHRIFRSPCGVNTRSRPFEIAMDRVSACGRSMTVFRLGVSFPVETSQTHCSPAELPIAASFPSGEYETQRAGTRMPFVRSTYFNSRTALVVVLQTRTVPP